MLCREIIDVIEGTYPKEAALAWDTSDFWWDALKKK